MAGNTTLGEAKKNKNDEFYTQLVDIERELKHYKEFFKGKVVYCNCDDPYESNFFKYFAMNFNVLKLKKLISVSYADSPVVGKEIIGFFDDQGEEFKISNKRAYKVVMSELKDITGDGREDLEDVKEIIKHRIRYLKGSGDFRSEESIELLKSADIIVTNPPFSLFREYIAQLMEYNKSFIILGNPNAIHYKEIFPLLKDNKVFIGFKSMGTDMLFDVTPEFADYLVKNKKEGSGYKIIDGKVKGRASAIWFTNFDHSKRHEFMDLYKDYSPEDYPKYDNYEAINIGKTAEIPADYDGVMGVPITFLDKYNPAQFEIVGMANGNSRLNKFNYDVPYTPHPDDRGGCGMVNGVRQYSRILIRRKKADK